MPRKPNYSFERFQRQTAKTAKREAKRAARTERLAQPGGEPADSETADSVTAEAAMPDPERTSAE
jgi:hypothetical protein